MINQIYSNITISLRLFISSPIINKGSSGNSTSFRHLLVHVSANQPNKLVEHFLSWAATLSVGSLLRGPISIILSWSHFMFLTSWSCTLNIQPHPTSVCIIWKNHGVHLMCSILYCRSHFEPHPLRPAGNWVYRSRSKEEWWYRSWGEPKVSFKATTLRRSHYGFLKQV